MTLPECCAILAAVSTLTATLAIAALTVATLWRRHGCRIDIQNINDNADRVLEVEDNPDGDSEGEGWKRGRPQD